MLYSHGTQSFALASASDGMTHDSPMQHSYSKSTADTPPLASENLLRGHKIVEIVHNGSLYKLQATKLGKLILTK